ncbi:MAG: transcription antitermination factor NusB [Thermodesulfovibrionales bacterium]|nr:transcription antitermination factor NusB [Thermodesulfovibrionales bacterium]
MKRRKARQYALQFLYGIDITSNSEKESIEDYREKLDVFWQETQEKDAEIIKFAEDIILKTLENQELIDTIIQSYAENWRLSRMSAVDRNILRLATFEILFRRDIPHAVTINEAIEIAKIYSSSESASFINGILDKIAKERRN